MMTANQSATANATYGLPTHCGNCKQKSSRLTAEALEGRAQWLCDECLPLWYTTVADWCWPGPPIEPGECVEIKIVRAAKEESDGE